MRGTQYKACDIGVLTVISPELQSARSAFGATERDKVRHNDGTVYWRGSVLSELKQRKFDVILAGVGIAGNASASGAATRMIDRFNPRVMLLIGIAAGIRGKVRIGDVLLSERIVGYEKSAVISRPNEPAKEERRPDIPMVSSAISQAMLNYEFNVASVGEIFHRIGGQYPEGPKGEQEDWQHVARSIRCHTNSTIASGDKLLRNASSLIDIRSNIHGKTSAGEMEASGFAEACNAAKIDWIVIRGISDFGDDFKDDQFHLFASRSAAAVAADFAAKALDIPLGLQTPIATMDRSVPTAGGQSVVPLNRLAPTKRDASELDFTEPRPDHPMVTRTPPPSAPPGPILTKGWIVICDIVRFSEKSEEEQVACVQSLSDITKNALNSTRGDSLQFQDVYLNCIGDGFILAVAYGVLRKPQAAVLEFCGRIVSNVSKSKARYQVRLGVHVGDYRVNVPAFGGNHVIGRGPNHCSRIVAAGDAGHVVVSEEFVKNYIEDIGSPRKAIFSPGVSKDPIFIAAKHGKHAPVRLYVSSLTSNEMPKRFLIVEELDNRIIANLHGLQKTIVEELSNRVSGNILRLRLSIFLPSRNRDILICSRYRVKQNRTESAGATQYKISPTDEAEGALGLAYVTGQSVKVKGLPNPENDPAAYTRAWKKINVNGRPLNISSDHIWTDEQKGRQKWNRCPQALIATPISTLDGDCAVLCVDARHPLEEISDEDFNDTANLIKEKAGMLFAGLLLARKVV